MPFTPLGVAKRGSGMKRVATVLLAITTGIGVLVLLIGGAQVAVGVESMFSDEATTFDVQVGQAFAARGLFIAVIGAGVCGLTALGRRKLRQKGPRV